MLIGAIMLVQADLEVTSAVVYVFTVNVSNEAVKRRVRLALDAPRAH